MNCPGNGNQYVRLRNKEYVGDSYRKPTSQYRLVCVDSEYRFVCTSAYAGNDMEVCFHDRKPYSFMGGGIDDSIQPIN